MEKPIGSASLDVESSPETLFERLLEEVCKRLDLPSSHWRTARRFGQRHFFETEDLCWWWEKPHPNVSIYSIKMDSKSTGPDEKDVPPEYPQTHTVDDKTRAASYQPDRAAPPLQPGYRPLKILEHAMLIELRPWHDRTSLDVQWWTEKGKTWANALLGKVAGNPPKGAAQLADSVGSASSESTASLPDRPKWFPKKPETREKWAKAWSLINRLLAEWAQDYDAFSREDPSPKLADVVEYLAANMHWRPSEKTAGRIKRAGSSGWLPSEVDDG